MTTSDERLIEEAREIIEQGDRYGSRAEHSTTIKTRNLLQALADRLAALSSPTDIPASAIMHRPGMSRDDLAACCAINAAAMHAGNLRDLLEDVATALQVSEGTDGALTLTEAVAAMRAVPSDLHEGSLQELLDDRARDGEPATPKPEGV